MGKISYKQVEEIFELTGIDKEGYQRIIENYFLFHVFTRHGNDKRERKRGQIGIRKGKKEIAGKTIFKQK